MWSSLAAAHCWHGMWSCWKLSANASCEITSCAPKQWVKSVCLNGLNALEIERKVSWWRRGYPTRRDHTIMLCAIPQEVFAQLSRSFAPGVGGVLWLMVIALRASKGILLVILVFWDHGWNVSHELCNYRCMSLQWAGQHICNMFLHACHLQWWFIQRDKEHSR